MSKKTKTPTRRKTDISQAFNSGILTIFEEENGAPPGYQPKPVMHALSALRYEEQALGINRYFQAQQMMIRVDRVLRIPEPGFDVTTDNVVQTESGAFYRITLIQRKTDVFPTCLDLTLVRYEGLRNHDVV